jgi:hypothetical protein
MIIHLPKNVKSFLKINATDFNIFSDKMQFPSRLGRKFYFYQY